MQLVVDNNTRLWVFSPQTLTCTDVPAMIGYCDQAQGSNRTYYAHYRAVGATTATSTSRPVATTTGGAPGRRSSQRCRETLRQRSNSAY